MIVSCSGEQSSQDNDILNEDNDSLNLETLIILIRTMEDAFSKAGYVDKSEVEVTITPKTPN